MAGEGFASGLIKLGGGLQVAQASSFTEIWRTEGAIFCSPTALQDGFSVLGHYAQPKTRMLDGWVLVAAEETPNGGVLAKPLDFTLQWGGASSGGYVWYPVPPSGYSAVGYFVSTSSTKPPLDAIRCVRSDLTDRCETDTLIWKPSNQNAVSFYSHRPVDRGTKAMGVPVGTFGVSSNAGNIACLKNTNISMSGMPSSAQVRTLYESYAPIIYCHPDEKYLPSSVPWYFSRGVFLYKKGDEANPQKVDLLGSNLPQGGPNDGNYWIDLKGDAKSIDETRKGDISTSEAYLHVKPMFGGTFTDLATWLFYPFNGPGRAKVGLATVPLGKLGEHACDWEHVTLRISNFSGKLSRVYCSQHSGGKWYEPSEIEIAGGKRVVAYSSLNGHAMYVKAGLELQGTNQIGLRNDTAKSNKVMDCAARYVVITEEIPWVNFYGEWGAKVTYSNESEMKKAESVLLPNVRAEFEKFVKSLPKEILGEESPTGPIVKSSWAGDEK